jgi:hypothetical protein
MKTRILIIIGICMVVITIIVMGANLMLQSNNHRELILDQRSIAQIPVTKSGLNSEREHSKENPYGFSAHMFYSKDPLPLMCPNPSECNTHLQLNIWSDVPAILQGYKICNELSCVIKDNIHFSTKDSAIIPVFDGNKWNVGDKVSINVQVVAQYGDDETHPEPKLLYIDLGEFEITEYGVILSTDITCSETLNLEIAKIPEDKEPSRLVFSVKQNTTAHICIKYTSNLYNEGTLNLNAESYDGYLGTYNGTKSNVSVTINPSFIPLQKGQSTIADYTITIPPNVYGVYWLWVSQMCERIPIVAEGYLLSPDDIPIFVGVHGCPAISLDAKIIGYSNADVQYHMAKALPGR